MLFKLLGRLVAAVLALIAGAAAAAFVLSFRDERPAVTYVQRNPRVQQVPPSAPDEPRANPGTGGEFRDGLTVTGSTPHRLILFTFDDGPDWKTTPKLLDELDAVGVKAVFFISAWRISGESFRQQQQRAIAQQIVARGHMVASHTYSHRQLTLLSNASIEKELLSTEVIFREVFGDRPWLFRPPGGAHSARVDALVANRGYTTMLWNLGTGDVRVDSPQKVFYTWRRVLSRREREAGDRGGIVLLHDTHAWSVEAFRLIYDELERRNCLLWQRGEELYDVVSDPRLFFVPRADAHASTVVTRTLVQPQTLEARQTQLRARAAARCSNTPTKHEQVFISALSVSLRNLPRSSIKKSSELHLPQ